MTGDAFEYAIKKDVRNNPIVREIDRDRYREMWRTIVVGLFVVAVLLFAVWRRLGVVDHGYHARGPLETRRVYEEERHRLLTATWEKLSSAERIERLARERLHMTMPGPDDFDVIELAIIASPAPRTAIARGEP
jgi:cell division protein FtsL